jgi:hypothetical protein
VSISVYLGFTNAAILKLGKRFEYGVFCKPWVVKLRES